MNSYILSEIGNTDEMPLYFDMLSYNVVDDFRAQSVTGETMGDEWMLAVLADLFYLNLCTMHLLLYV